MAQAHPASPSAQEIKKEKLWVIPIEDLTEENRLECFRLIDEDQLAIKAWEEKRQVELLYIHHPESRDLNVLMYAIWKGKLRFAQRCLRALLAKGNAEQVHDIVLAKSLEQENCLQHLIGSMLEAEAKAKHYKEPRDVHEKNLQSSIAHLLLEVCSINFRYVYELVTNPAEQKRCAIIQAVSSDADWADDLTNAMFRKLNYDGKMKLFHDPSLGSDAATKQGKAQEISSNLLYLAQEGTYHAKTVKSILDFVVTDARTSLKNKNANAIVLGNTSAVAERSKGSSLYMAAVYNKWEHLLWLVKAVQLPERFKALMETVDGEVSESALGWLLWYPKALQKVTEISFFENSILEALKELKWEMLFAEHQMPLEAVEILGNLMDFSDSFLIPKFNAHLNPPVPSIDSGLPVSRPVAMLFYNESTGKRLLKHVKPESEKMRDALLKLGWGEDNVVLDRSKWTAEEMEQRLTRKLDEVKSYCSIFLLCMTGHGSETKMEAHGETSVEINDIINACTDPKRLKVFIPKVIILDRCRAGKWKRLPCLLREGNVLILDATLAKTVAHDGHYLTKLAEQIRRGNDTLQRMHKRASRLAAAEARNARTTRKGALEQFSESSNSSGSESDVDDTNDFTDKQVKGDADKVRSKASDSPKCQIPTERASVNKDIFLRKFLKEYSKNEESEMVFCNQCYDGYKLEDEGLELDDKQVLEKVGVKWFCKYCR